MIGSSKASAHRTPKLAIGIARMGWFSVAVQAVGIPWLSAVRQTAPATWDFRRPDAVLNAPLNPENVLFLIALAVGVVLALSLAPLARAARSPARRREPTLAGLVLLVLATIVQLRIVLIPMGPWFTVCLLGLTGTLCTLVAETRRYVQGPGT